jgi:FKBP-type peptidyl-prolyl cis-trans isomerase 2
MAGGMEEDTSEETTDEDMVAQYSLARRDYPDANVEEIAVVILRRMGTDGAHRLAGEALRVEAELTDSAEVMALNHVRHFVYEMEEPDSDDDDDLLADA